MVDASPHEDKHEPGPPRESSREDDLCTWQGPSPWDPGGKPPRGHISSLKRACRGRQERRREHRRPQQEKPGRTKTSQPAPQLRSNHAPPLSIIAPSHRREVYPIFLSRPIQRARLRPGECKGVAQAQDIATRGRLLAVTPFRHTHVTLSSRASPRPAVLQYTRSPMSLIIFSGHA